MTVIDNQAADAYHPFEDIIEVLHEAILIFDNDRRIHAANTMFYEQFQLAETDVLQQDLLKIHKGLLDVGAIRRLIAHVQANPDVIAHSEFPVSLESSSVQVLHCNIRQLDATRQPWIHGTLFIMAIDNITDLTITQRSLQNKIEELERQNQALDAFAEMVAHDLKNPISSMMGFASLIEQYHERMSPEELVENARAVIESGRHLKRTIDSMLLLTGADRGMQVTVEPLNMHRIVESVKRSLDDLIQESQARVNLPTDWHTAQGYAPWIEAIWMNYISNAIKYGGNPPVIRLGSEQLDDGRVHFFVEDNGVGIAEPHRQSVFQPYTRLSTATGGREIEGSGLGLSVVLRVVERLGGEVTVDSEPGQGSRFGFILPPPT